MRAFLLLLLLLPAACTLTPIYAGGAAGPAATTLGGVIVSPIPDRAGFLVRDQVVQQLGEGGPARYRLDVALDDGIIGFGVRGDNSIIRERRTLRARWQLVDLETGKPVIDTTASADAGIDVVTSEFAVVAAEQTALERLAEDIAGQIVARIARYGQETRTTVEKGQEARGR